MSPEENIGWEAVAEACESAKAIAWDGCHKIYLAMDDDQVSRLWTYRYGEDGSEMFVGKSPEYMLALVKAWYSVSCGLKFVTAVHTMDDPNEGFVDLVPQGYDPDTKEWL